MPGAAIKSTQTPEPGGTSPERPLPPGWRWVTLRQVAQISGGITKGQKRRYDEIVRKVPYLRVANVQRGYLDLTEVKEIEATEAEIESLRLHAGDILFNEGGDRDKLGRGWVWNGELRECVHQNHVFRARVLDPGVLPKFLSFYGNSEGQHYFLEQGNQTTNLASINLTKLGRLPIPLPPSAEQRRIVAEIERQLTRLDVGKAALRRVNKNLERFCAAVLKAACQGTLLPSHKGELSPIVALSELGEVYCGQSSSKSDVNTSGRGVPYISGPEHWDGHKVHIDKWTTSPKRTVPAGCVFITVKGAGVGTVFPGVESAIGRDIYAFKPNTRVLPRFLEFTLRHTAAEVIRSAHGDIPGLSKHHITSHTMVLPSIDEQRRIVAEVERRFSVVNAIESVAKNNLVRVGHMQQVILRRAFEGRLIPQDNQDESIDNLLERIEHSPSPPPTKRKPKLQNQPNRMISKPVASFDQFLVCLDALGGTAAPDELLQKTGLGHDVETFFDLLRHGKFECALSVPTGMTGTITKISHAP